MVMESLRQACGEAEKICSRHHDDWNPGAGFFSINSENRYNDHGYDHSTHERKIEQKIADPVL